MMGCEYHRKHFALLLTLCTDGADKGIIPLTCEELFGRLDQKRLADPETEFRVEVSFIEVSLSPYVTRNAYGNGSKGQVLPPRLSHW